MLPWTTRRMRRLAWFIVVVLSGALSVLPVGHARAQRNRALDAAERSGAQADFDAALRAYDRATADGGLSRQDLIELLSRRPVIYQALGDEVRMERDLAALAALLPEYEFGPEVMPAVRSAFAKVRLGVEPLHLDLKLEPGPRALGITAQCPHAPDGLVVETRVYGRIAGRAFQAQRDRLTIDDPDRLPIDYYAEVYGPGQALLLTRGSRDAPLHFDLASHDSDAGDHTLWWVLGGGAVVLVGATVLLVALMSHSDHTQFAAPMVQ